MDHIVSTETLAQLGPIGILLILGLVVYLRLGPQASRNHAENSGKLDAILDQVSKINGRVGKMEEWRDGHDKQDDEREIRHDKKHGDIQQELDRNRGGLDTLRTEIAAASLRATIIQKS